MAADAQGRAGPCRAVPPCAPSPAAFPASSPAHDPYSVWRQTPDPAQGSVLFIRGRRWRQASSTPGRAQRSVCWGQELVPFVPHPGPTRLDGDWRRVFVLKEFIVLELRVLTVI